ncbi:MAG: hypothetical protein KGQ68_03150 [Gammaproteobacteria bacterium]|nr:hypothetical protein [Gammaproteobacteria bacterium]
MWLAKSVSRRANQMKPICFICGFFLFLSSNLCAAYEPGTHRRLSDAAASTSVLVQKSAGTNTNVLDDLGLKEYPDNRQQFTDSQVGEFIYLDPDKKDLFKAASTGSVQYLIQAGAALEDEGFRSLCHFYDPLAGHTHPLSALGFTARYSAPEWATGYTDSETLADGVCQFGPVWSSPQLYSLKNAQEYFYKALTLSNKSDRNLQFGNVFLSLGHAMHLLQDTSVPQHVRDDMHCDDPLCKIVNLHHPSKYESYTYLSAPIGPSAYGSVSFPDGNARAFWSNDAGSGIAQFTNRNFLSVRTMAAFGAHDANAEYPMPVWNGAASVESIYNVFRDLNQPVPEQIASACPQESTSTPCAVTFLASTGTDQFTGSSITNPRAATLSLFDEDLKAKEDTEVFALNRANYQAAWGFLIPRAIAYSTGLINHFFRGRLDVQPDPNTEGGYLVINKSSYPMSNGTLTLYYDDADGNRYPVPDASWSNVSIDPAGGDDTTGYPIQFSAPTDPVPATSGEYMLVFQGKIGSEEGIAGKLIKAGDQYVYLAASMSSWCTWYYNCASVVESFDAAYKIHSSSVHLGTLVLPESLAVYDGVDYTIENIAPYNTNYDCYYLAMRNGEQFAASDCKGESIPLYLNAIAVNTEHVYVFANQKYNYSSGIVNLYDHAGNFKSSITNLPLWYIYKASVTDSRMCLNGFGVSSDSVSLLTDLDGNKLAAFPTDPIYGAYCALTQDRMYLLNLYDGNAVLNVYDLNGSLITSLDASVPTPPKTTYLTYWDIAASDQKIYIPIIYELMDPDRPITFIYKFIVYEHSLTRGPDGAITDKFQRKPDVTLPGLQNYFGASVAVDMKDVLGSPRQ